MTPYLSPSPPSGDHDRIPPADATASRGPATGADAAPEVVDGTLLDEPECTRRALPVVLPSWLGSRRRALVTLRWALRYAGRHLGFHVVRAPGYGLGLVWWMLRGTGRALAAAFGWVSARG